MLTIKSNFIEFKDRQGEVYTAEDLDKLSKALITCDIVNFRGNIGRGYTDALAKKILDKAAIKSGKVLVINDVTLHMTRELLAGGFKPEDIYLVYGKWENSAAPSELTTVYTIMHDFITTNINEQLNIKPLKEIFRMNTKFDLIIANPPYGKIGANITKKIIDTVNFKEYINLLPANDYKRNGSKDLFNYQSDMISIKDGFADAAVTTHLARIHKSKVNNTTLDEFERSQYIDRQLDKYFEENSRRTHYAIDKMPACGLTKKNAGIWNISKTFIIALRDMNHKHMGGKNSATYKWNIEEIGDMNSLPGSDEQFFVSNLEFASDIEKKNLVRFVYYGDEAKFVQKIFTALNCDGSVHLIAIPKVDWTRSWTVEEILADYGYTEEEIKEVMEDLKNYKEMAD